MTEVKKPRVEETTNLFKFARKILFNKKTVKMR